MKKIWKLLIWALISVPFYTNAQTDCFQNVPADVGYFDEISEYMNCALVQEQGECKGIITNETVEVLNAAGSTSTLDFCDIWCLADNGPGWNTIEGQKAIFENIIALAPQFAPQCQENGEPMKLISIAVELNSGGGQTFVIADLTFACCIIPDDCEADYDVYWDASIGACEFVLTNGSTPSAENDCGDCNNPSGITAVNWSVSTIHGTGPIQWISPHVSSTDFHFSFGLSNASAIQGYQICLKIEDCVGCVDKICKTVDNPKGCIGFTGNDDGGVRNSKRSNHSPISLYPNPSNQNVNILINKKEFETNTSSIDIYDMQGKLMKSVKAIQHGLNTINVTDLNSNIYILVLTLDGKRVHSEKIIIER